ncbi:MULTISPECIES: PilZ domain-containing protein [Marinobacter]|uniref:Cyclic diguanosine monophosphate-binding protein n=1 Tax=Marinobacter xestospongiae TaxID=994319 RepID=A0ABU3W365_9GAMM|nr:MULTISPECIES: PilZ domain-containing protein [Marinobacter]MCG8520551.1 PilZ domain-containing protein [Pseudomonadales bacterium]MCK7568822.1 PilZ domain-containing protein [Marinobacter xestospongiae]MDV2080866.1 PilZ domain-containing protein [Marinobacter xestospongiae]UDL04401.1 PilZ domain-containing protein [Marinobacter sp. CA1]
MTDQTTEKRRFHRIEFDAPCELFCQDRVWATKVLDISLKGVLVARPDDWDVPLNQPSELVVQLNGENTAIVMAVELRHIEPERLGFQCQYIDLESASHLKRLVELNLGDPELLEREFAHLIE